MVLLKGSSVLMICQKITKKPVIFNISGRLVALRVGTAFIMRVWGTECYHPRKTLETSKDVRRTFVPAGSVGTPTAALPVFSSDLGTLSL